MSENTKEKRETKAAFSPPLGGAQNQADDAETYLLAKGWEKLPGEISTADRWDDPLPKTMKAEWRVTRLTDKFGKEQLVRQLFTPPCPWAYSLHDAVRIQRLRDAEEARKLEPAAA